MLDPFLHGRSVLVRSLASWIGGPVFLLARSIGPPERAWKGLQAEDDARFELRLHRL